MAPMRAAAVPLALLGTAAASKQQVTPVEKVISLLTGMADKLKEESSAEAATYDTFACYCKDTTAAKSESIKSGQDSIDLLSAEIASKTAEKADKTSELGENKAKLEKLQQFLKETEVRCAKEKAEYQAKDADLVKAISSLDSAMEAMESSKPGAAAAGRPWPPRRRARSQVLPIARAASAGTTASSAVASVGEGQASSEGTKAKAESEGRGATVSEASTRTASAQRAR